MPYAFLVTVRAVAPVNEDVTSEPLVQKKVDKQKMNWVCAPMGL